ncbi:MAG: InlB B-repeat-containing protein, partial [Candidatus Micrarchaeaceae archaeon]
MVNAMPKSRSRKQHSMKVGKWRKVQPSIEYLSTFAVALLLLTIVIAIVGFVLLSNKGSTNTPSSCYISPQIYCFQFAIANNGMSNGKTTAAVVFTNNLQIPITFPQNSFIVFPSSSRTGSIGSCYPSVASPGATVVCNVTISGYTPQIGTQLAPNFQISYNECSGTSCTSYNTTGTGTTYVSAKLPPFHKIKLLSFPYSYNLTVEGVQYESDTFINFINGTNYYISADNPPGVQFMGWESSGGVSVANLLQQRTTASATSNGTLEAIYICYGLSLQGSPSGTGTEAASPTYSGNCPVNSYLPGTHVSITATPLNSALYAFSSWSGSGSGQYSGSSNPAPVVMNGNIIETANYQPVCYSVTLSASPSSYGTVSQTPSPSDCAAGSYPAGTSVTITATPNTGYTFSSWSAECGTNASCTFSMPTSSLSITASFAQACYSVTLSGSPSAGGTESQTGSTCAADSYVAGTSVTITATPASGYSFSSWSAECGTSSSCTFSMPTGSLSLTATYTQNCYSVTLSGSPSAGGTESQTGSSGSCATDNYVAGTSVTITATPAAGYAFSSWSAECGTNASCAFTMPTSSLSL